MNSKFLKSQILVVICSFTSLTTVPLHGVTHKLAMHDSDEHARLEAFIQNIFTKFEQTIELFKQQLSGISPNSTEKLTVVCIQLKKTIDQVDGLFIDPIRKQVNALKGTHLESSNYYLLLNTLLDICAELKTHFDHLHSALNKSLHSNPTAVNIAKNLQPIINGIIADSNFKKIDALLAQAYKYTLSYDIIIEIKPQHRKIINIKDDNPSKTYHLKLAQAFAVLREALEELRKECRKPSAINHAEILRMIRRRL